MLILAYVLMASAGATHEISHFAASIRAHAACSASDTGAQAPSAAAHTTDDHHLPDADFGSSFCFFCAHCPNVLTTPVVVHIDGVETFCEQFPSRLEHRRALPATLAIISLRAPPAIA